ncbi:MAG TPA: hypothetical protein VFZ08_03505 [Terriglobia bacterium]|nr:hypothetical protein [Terriglobia bacterium]
MPAEVAVAEPKGPQTAVQHPARRRPAQAEPEGEVAVRYFLAGKEMNGGSPSLGRELSSENDALVESLKTGVNFYAVSEYRAAPDMSGKAPLIRKEAVKKAVKSDK